MESMTGFGAASVDSEAGSISVQISSVNNRGCRVNVRSDLRDLALEELARTVVQDGLRRGSITVQIGFRAAARLGLDPAALSATWRELAALAEELGAPQPTLADAARIAGRSGGETDLEQLKPLVEQACREAVAACVAMRREEGAALHQAFRGHHAALFELKTRIAIRAAERPVAYAERLQERLQEVVRDRAEISPEHLVRELAIYADRIDVTEELVRLDSHLEQLGRILAADEPAGRKLEFLLQEFGREINTTGAKANDAELQQLVVEAKGVVEQLKEQAANVI
jgi:uncharacterized protein (TIGR00255 family)